MTLELFAADVLALVIFMSKLLVALMPVLVVVAPLAIPLIARSIKDKRHAEAFNTVSRMGLLATNAAAAELAKGFSAATDPNSPGGVQITQGEMLEIMGRAAMTSFKWAKDQKVLSTVLKVYGGEDAVKASITAIINDKLSGSPVGVGVRAQLHAKTVAIEEPAPWNFQPHAPSIAASQEAAASAASAALFAPVPAAPAALPVAADPVVTVTEHPVPVTVAPAAQPQYVPTLAEIAGKPWNLK